MIARLVIAGLADWIRPIVRQRWRVQSSSGRSMAAAHWPGVVGPRGLAALGELVALGGAGR